MKAIVKFRKAGLILVCYLLPLALLAANDGKIIGRVTDKITGAPLIGANVLIDKTVMGSSTDQNGQFVILNVHPGSYTIVVNYMGYQSVSEIGVAVRSDNTTWMEVSLNPTVIEGTAVTITAQAPLIDKGSTGSKQVASSDEFLKEPIHSVQDVLETQSGIFQGTYRGDSQVQMVYMLNDISVNSGLFSDNFTGFNLSAVQEISVLTGGYSAEYGEARAAVVNVVEKMSSEGIHGTVQTRLRPAGKYHFGRNMYSKDNYDYTYYNLTYWTAQSENPISAYYGQDPQALLTAWRNQITPNADQADYAKRDELDYEATLFGGIFKNLNFMLSGRYKKGVNIFPQGIPYNPEYNVQGYLNYSIIPSLKLRVGGFFGGYESADPDGTNFDSWENAQEYQWISAATVTSPYAENKYNPLGVIYDHYPELRKWNQAYARLTHSLSERAFYRVIVSYLYDNMNRSDRYGVTSDSLWSRRDDTYLMVTNFRKQGYFHAWDKNECTVKQFSFDYTNQYLTNQQLKFGVGYKKYVFDVQHFMASYEGGGRWNLLNVFAGKPYEGHAYIQNLMEYPGIILNAGLRLDFFNQNRNASANMYDPLAIELSTPGHNPNQPQGIPGDPETTPTKLQWRVAPRLSISHPISDKSILRFSYGHFYQRPSWSKMFGFPFVNYTEDMSTMLDPFASNDTLQQITYMEEWQGFYGNPKLTYERSIQYELGVDYVLLKRFLIKFSGYYKDSDAEASVITGLYAKDYTATKAFMVSNGGYSDTRGVEIKLDTRFPGFLNFGGSFDTYWNSSGEVGYSRLNEPGSIFINLPIGLNSEKGIWSGFQKVKGWISFDTAPNYGPKILQIKPLGDWHLYSFFWWRSGDPYTYHAPGDLSTRENNRRWFNIYQFNLKMAKGFQVGQTRLELSADIRNLFNNKFLRRLYGDDLKYYHQNSNLSLEDRLPKSSFSGEPNVWSWYTYEVPPRQIYFQLKMDF